MQRQFSARIFMGGVIFCLPVELSIHRTTFFKGRCYKRIVMPTSAIWHILSTCNVQPHESHARLREVEHPEARYWLWVAC